MAGTTEHGPERTVATFCSYIPHEILQAADLKPFRMIGDGKPARKSEAFVPACMCSYSMNCLDLVLGQTPVADALVFANSCHAMETLHETVKEFCPTPSFLLDVPRKSSPAALEYFCVELRKFRTALGEHFGVEISDEKLRRSIASHNRARRLRAELERLIARGDVILTADEMVLLGQKSSADPEEFMNEAMTLTHGATERREQRRRLPRIMVVGSVCAPMDIARVIEEYGASVVLCHTCTNFRTVMREIAEDIDPIAALAQGYLNKPGCPRQCDAKERTDDLARCTNEYRIDGVIFSVLKFCPDQSYDVLVMTRALQKENVPCLVLGSEYSDTSSAQAHTRIQAFLECLESVNGDRRNG